MQLLAGKPLIAWTIEAAMQAGLFDQIIVSTDSEEIAGFAKSFGVQVPSLRPSYLATDYASASEVIAFYVEPTDFDNVCYLQPTSPLRVAKDIINSFEMLADPETSAVISVSKLRTPAPWIFYQDHDFAEFIAGLDISRSQDLPLAMALNGAIFWFERTAFEKFGTHLIPVGVRPYQMPPHRSIDIDDTEDLIIADALLNAALKETTI